MEIGFSRGQFKVLTSMNLTSQRFDVSNSVIHLLFKLRECPSRAGEVLEYIFCITIN